MQGEQSSHPEILNGTTPLELATERPDSEIASTLALEGAAGAAELPAEARIWIGSLALSDGKLHGEWIDATQEPQALHAEVLRALAASSEVEAQAWGIFDYQGFGEHNLDDFKQLKAVAALAQGIGEHGPAFAAWADYLGHTQLDQLNRFQEHFLGTWPSLRAYVESYLDGIGFAYDFEQAIKDLPDHLHRHIALDIDAVAREWEHDLHVVDHPGGVWVFTP